MNLQANEFNGSLPARIEQFRATTFSLKEAVRSALTSENVQEQQNAYGQYLKFTNDELMTEVPRLIEVSSLTQEEKTAQTRNFTALFNPAHDNASNPQKVLDYLLQLSQAIKVSEPVLSEQEAGDALSRPRVSRVSASESDVYSKAVSLPEESLGIETVLQGLLGQLSEINKLTATMLSDMRSGDSSGIEKMLTGVTSATESLLGVADKLQHEKAALAAAGDSARAAERSLSKLLPHLEALETSLSGQMTEAHRMVADLHDRLEHSRTTAEKVASNFDRLMDSIRASDVVPTGRLDELTGAHHHLAQLLTELQEGQSADMKTTLRHLTRRMVRLAAAGGVKADALQEQFTRELKAMGIALEERTDNSLRLWFDEMSAVRAVDAEMLHRSTQEAFVHLTRTLEDVRTQLQGVQARQVEFRSSESAEHRAMWEQLSNVLSQLDAIQGFLNGALKSQMQKMLREEIGKHETKVIDSFDYLRRGIGLCGTLLVNSIGMARQDAGDAAERFAYLRERLDRASNRADAAEKSLGDKVGQIAGDMQRIEALLTAQAARIDTGFAEAERKSEMRHTENKDAEQELLRRLERSQTSLASSLRTALESHFDAKLKKVADDQAAGFRKVEDLKSTKDIVEAKNAATAAIERLLTELKAAESATKKFNDMSGALAGIKTDIQRVGSQPTTIFGIALSGAKRFWNWLMRGSGGATGGTPATPAAA